MPGRNSDLHFERNIFRPLKILRIEQNLVSFDHNSEAVIYHIVPLLDFHYRYLRAGLENYQILNY